MKKLFILFAMLIIYQSLTAQEKQIKFYMNDSSYKAYNINEIDSINLIKSNSNYVMKIFYRDSMVAYYPTEVISKIQFDKDSSNNMLLNVYVFGYPTSYKLSDVDSIYFYIDIYQPLTIGSQVWMLKNLSVDYYRNEASIPEVRYYDQWANLTTGAWCYYNNDPANGKIYGKLYNWYAVTDLRGLAPYGWHVPSDKEWGLLTNYLGGGWVAGGKLKEAGTNHWNIPNVGGTNESGFTALPGGCRGIEGFFYGYGDNSSWWQPSDTTNILCLFLSFSDNYVRWSSNNKELGIFVRCIKD